MDQDSIPVSFFVTLTDRQSLFLATIFILNICIFFLQGPLLFFFHELALLFIDCNISW